MTRQSKFSVETQHTYALDCHPTRAWLLTLTAGFTTIYNLESGKPIHSFRDYGYCAKFIARKNWYIMGSGTNLQVFSCTTHEKVVDFRAHKDPICCLAIHPTDPIVLTGSFDRTIKAWSWDEQWHNIRTYEGHTNWVRSIAFNPKERNMFASASDDGTIKMWSSNSPIPRFSIAAHNGLVLCVDFCPDVDKPLLVTAGTDYTVKVWDYLSQTCIQTIEGHTGAVHFAAFHPSLPIIISGSKDRSVKIWNSETYRMEHTHTYGFGETNCISFCRETSEVAVGFNEGVLTIALAHIGSLQVRGNMSSGTLKQNLLEGRDIKEPMRSTTTDAERKLELVQSLDGLAIANNTALSLSMPFMTPVQLTGIKEPMRSTTTDVERKFELVQSLDGLATTYNATLSLSMPSTTPLQSRSQHEADSYQHCITIAIELVLAKPTNKLISELRDDQAQHMADFLSKVISDDKILPRHERKRALHLLSKLAKSAEVFPQSLELEGVKCDLITLVAAGGYGLIYKGEYQERSVCVKAVHIDSHGIDRQKLRAHASELTIWAHIDHPNILPFVGIYSSKEAVPRICIVSPWMVNGDLLRYLGQAPDVPRKPLVQDILSGLQYLHDLDIIHADLKAKNVLVSETGKAMLADFGISQLSVTLTTTLTNAGIGSAYWMAPELQLDDQPRPTRETDIWAFACTCYEIITRKIPFGEYHNPAILVGAFFRGKIVPEKPENPGKGWDEDVWSVAMRCWQRDPASRPQAHELLVTMNSFDFEDDRASDPISKKGNSSSEIDYDCILGILNEIRESAAM